MDDKIEDCSRCSPGIGIPPRRNGFSANISGFQDIQCSTRQGLQSKAFRFWTG
uniref:Uncharacterized protein n=1 Tax=Rhizophora mucronata TaxID=61149 RepID=A0A2P2Q5A1_RHIMU